MSMNARLLILATASAVLALACAEHEPAGPGPGDVTPPAVSSVTAWDRNHVVVIFDERVTPETADNPLNYELGGEAAGRKPKPVASDQWGVPCDVCAAVLRDDSRTVMLTTDILDATRWSVKVRGVADVHGNVITNASVANFQGSDDDDTTPPEVIVQWPEPGATEVSMGGFVRIGFSEPVAPDSFQKSFHMSGEGVRLISIRNDDAFMNYDCDFDILKPDADYTVSLSGVNDLALNRMHDVQWTFRTAGSLDIDAPRVISSRPAANAVNVNLASTLSLTFSEPMDPHSLQLLPSIGTPAMIWSNGGSTVTFDTALQPGRQYTIQIRPGSVRDFTGNPSTDVFTLMFSTDGALRSGRFSGTMVGDFQSSGAYDPAGSLVFAGRTPQYNLVGSVVTTVAGAGSYAVQHLYEGTYYPFGVKDSNRDGLYEPKYGDAIAIYGISDFFSEQAPRAINVGDIPVTGVDMRLYDPTAIHGLISNREGMGNPVYVGLFVTDNFDPVTSVPVISTFMQPDGVWDFVINSLWVGPIPDGDYYVAAYLDATVNGIFDPEEDLYGVYGGDTPAVVHVGLGVDTPNTNIVLKNPFHANARAVRWPVARPSTRLKPFLEENRVAQD